MTANEDTVPPLPSELPSSPIHSPAAHPTHRKNSSSLSDFTLLELDRKENSEIELIVNEHPEENPEIPMSTLVVVTESQKLEANVNSKENSVLQNLVEDITEFDFTLEDGVFKCRNWAGVKGYSDYIAEGLKYKNVADPKVVMLFESPSTSTDQHSFHNKTKFRFHDWPPPAPTGGKSVLGPCRYALMNGTSFPVFLKDGQPPAGLVDHWLSAVPDFQPPNYIEKITDDETVYAYLPVEQIRNHVNDPDVHYHLAGKDAIHLMTQKTTALLPDTRTVRPCVVKTTHSMGSKGIFIINNDKDEDEFLNFLNESGNPTFVITDFVDIARNVACHFFMHPNGSVVWFGSNENHREADGSFSSDSYLIWEHQEKLKEIQLPFVEEVVQYCHGLGFWGFCGIDVLFDSQDRGYLVDINPRVTGSCPALMTLKKLRDKYGFTVGLFRRSGPIHFYGNPDALLDQVNQYNLDNEGKSRIVIHSMYQSEGKKTTRVNIGVYGNNLNDCKNVLNTYAKAAPKN